MSLCDPMNYSMLGSSVLHSLPEFVQARVHWAGNAVYPSHPLLLLSLLPSIFPTVEDFSNESALHIRWPKYWSFSFRISPPKNIQDRFLLGLTGLILQFKELSSVFSSNAIQKYQIVSLSLLYGPALTSVHEKIHSFDCIRPLLVKWCVCFLTCCLGLS